MALTMTVVETSGISTVKLDEEIEKDLLEAYEKLANLPANRALNVDFEDAKAARLFCRQGKAWAATMQGPNGRDLEFARKGDIKGQPSRVTFRIYEKREPKA